MTPHSSNWSSFMACTTRTYGILAYSTQISTAVERRGEKKGVYQPTAEVKRVKTQESTLAVKVGKEHPDFDAGDDVAVLESRGVWGLPAQLSYP